MARKTKQIVSDKRQLEIFVERVQELANTRMMRDNQLYNYKPTIKMDFEAGTSSVDAQEPDEDDLKSFLLTFRHFVSNDEPVYFYKVCNTATKCLKSQYQENSGFLAKAREEWHKAEIGVEVLIVDNKHLTGDYVLDLYINGQYFHNDPEYADKLKEFEKNSIRLDKLRFLLSLQDFTNIINQVGNFVAYGLKNDWFDF